MRLYREKAKAEALALLDASGSTSEVGRQVGIPESTLRSWRDAELDNQPHTDAETRELAKKQVITVSEIARSVYLDHMIEPAVVAKESGYYSSQVVRNMTEVIQLLTGGPTSRFEGSLEGVLRAAVGGGGKTDPDDGGG